MYYITLTHQFQLSAERTRSALTNFLFMFFPPLDDRLLYSFLYATAPIITPKGSYFLIILISGPKGFLTLTSLSFLYNFLNLLNDIWKSYCTDQKNSDDQQDYLCVYVSLSKTNS